MKYVFIINPASGKTDYNKIKENIIKTLENEDYEIYETKAPKEATQIANRFKNEENTVVYSVGGDGTLNEVVNGIAEGKCKLGIIPTGSGNDFYRTLKETKNENIRLDLGKVNGRYFINIASVGMDAETCNNANKIKSKIGSNINQLTKLSNQGSITNVDLENVKEELKNIWQLLNLLIQNQN